MKEAKISAEKPFCLEEATIDKMHRAIRSGEITAVEIVQHYIARARAYNGVSSALVTADGEPVPPATGTVRAGAPLAFPTATVKASMILPDLDKYKGKPLEYGRMEPTSSDPGVQQQFGMIAGIPNSGQLNALATLNIRGERSVTCRGDYDRHPSKGPLPPGAPAVCEIFRRLPDALETAAELDAKYGRHPDLEKMPMYGVVFSFKDPFDTKDMRSTGGGDAAYDIDFPARDHTLVEQPNIGLNIPNVPSAYALVPVDFRAFDYKTGQGLLWDKELADYLGKIKAGRMWINIDSCFSGGFNQPGITGPNRVVTMSSQGDQLSSEIPDAQHGVLMQYMIQEGMAKGLSVEDAFAAAAPRPSSIQGKIPKLPMNMLETWI